MPLSPTIQAYVDQKQLTPEQAMGLDENGRKNLESQAIRGFIANGKLTLEQAIGLDGNGRWNLASQAIRGFIEKGKLTLGVCRKFCIYKRVEEGGARSVVA